jgi:hypothetical protein
MYQVDVWEPGRGWMAISLFWPLRDEANEWGLQQFLVTGRAWRVTYNGKPVR